MLETLAEIRSNVASTTRETQINSLIDTFINLTLQEINDPAWSFEQVQAFRGYAHLWTFNERTFTLYTRESFNQLPRDLDKLVFVRTIPEFNKLKFIPTDAIPDYFDGDAEGTPTHYTIWTQEGVEISLSTDDTIDLVSSSASDGSAFTLSIVGDSTSDYSQSEVYTLNGLTEVTGTKTFSTNKPLRVSKSGKTTGYITLHEHTSGHILGVIAPEERSPRFRMIAFYPAPSYTTGAITAIANYGGTVPGTVLITSASHGLASGDTDDVIIYGTTNYNGQYDVTYVDANHFYITATWGASETGHWTTTVPFSLAYYTRIRQLVNDSDVPDIDEKWLWVVRLGAIAKVYQYQGKETQYGAAQSLYAAGVRSMVRSDMFQSDYIPKLKSHRPITAGVIKVSDDVASGFYGDGFGLIF